MTVLRQLQAAEPAEVIAKGQVPNLPHSSLTTIATFTANGFNRVTRVSCTGEYSAVWQLFHNTVWIESKKATPGLDTEFFFNAPFKLVAGDIFDVKVIHYFNGKLPLFEATIYGFSD